MNAENREYHKRAWLRLDTMCHFEIRLLRTLPLRVEDQFSAPIRSPLDRHIAYERETPARRGHTLPLIDLVGIVMGQQTISSRV
jgi:hypothetical protein